MGLREDRVGSLENEAKRRKEKLLALKRRCRGGQEETQEQGKQETQEEGNQETQEEGKQGTQEQGKQDGEGGGGGVVQGGEELPATQVLFRNYKPGSEVLQAVTLPAEIPTDVDTLVKTQLEDGEKAKEEVQVEITNLAPKKITYDLKRCIQPQLDRLERRTDKAIAELIRQRLKEGKQQDFLIAVNAGAQAQQKTSFDSDED